MQPLKIDGSFGEGGGQIVRTAITLSCITNQPIIIENIRKNRKSPGLKAQHITAIKILQKMCNAIVEGANIGSTTLKFIPKKIQNVTLSENVGTAGSISLILQVLIPVAAICKTELDLTIKGGTDGKWSPTIDYTQYVLREVYSRMGIKFAITVIRRGYYPKGGGIVKVNVAPSKKIIPIILKKRVTKNTDLFCSYSKLPKKIILDKINEVKNKLIQRDFKVDLKILKEDAADSGSAILLCSIDSHSIVGIDSLFDVQLNRFSEDVADRFVQSNLGVDDNLADMIVVPASMTNGINKVWIKNITKHLETNLYVTSKMTGCRYGIGKINDGFELRIEGISNASIK